MRADSIGKGKTRLSGGAEPMVAERAGWITRWEDSSGAGRGRSEDVKRMEWSG